MIGIACGETLVEALQRGLIAYGRPDESGALVVTDIEGKVICGKLPPAPLILQGPRSTRTALYELGRYSEADTRAMRACIDAQKEAAVRAELCVRTQVAIARSRQLIDELRHQMRRARAQHTARSQPAASAHPL